MDQRSRGEAEVVQAEGPDFEIPSNAKLIREAIDGTRDLVRLEVELARQELGEELVRAKSGAVMLAAAAAMAVVGVTMLLATIALAAGRSWLCALLIGGGALLAAGLLGWSGWRAVPLQPLPATRERVEVGLRSLRERVA